MTVIFKINNFHIFKNISLSLLLIIVLNSQVFSQSKIDSLQTILDIHNSKSGNDSRAAQILIDLYRETCTTNPIAAIQYAANALQIYTQINDSLGIAVMKRYIGDNYFQRKIYNMAMDSYLKSQNIFEILKNKEETAYTLLKIGETHLKQKIDSKAEEAFNQAYFLFKEIESPEGLSFTLDNMAVLKLKDYNDKVALEKLDSSLSIRIKINNKSLIAASFRNIANLYYQIEEYEKANIYLIKALNKYLLTNNKIKVADTYFKLGKNYIILNKFTDAENSFKSAHNIYTKASLTKKISETENNLGIIALNKKDFKKAKQYAKKTVYVSLINDYKYVRRNSYKLYADIFEKTADLKKALKYMNLYAALSDTIFSDEQNMQLVEVQVNLATQKEVQKNEILIKNQQLQDIELKRQETDKKFLYTAVTLLVITLAFTIIFGLYYYKTNKKTKISNVRLIEKNEEIYQQKEEISEQKDKLELANTSITEHVRLIELKTDRIEASLNYASRIQRAMLPKMNEVREKLPESFVMLSPKEAVSGDFFWYASVFDENNNEKLVLAAVDCTGHGVPGAFMSMMGDAYLNQIVTQQKISSPEIILLKLHEGIASSLQQGKTFNTDGMDVAISVIDIKNKTLEFAGAKNPLVYIQNGKMKVIKGDSISIGGLAKGKERKYKKTIIDISKPIRFYMYSDGFQDQFGGPNNKKYMALRFRDFLYSIHKQPINEQAVSLAVELDEWKKEKSQMDDVLVMGARINL